MALPFYDPAAVGVTKETTTSRDILLSIVEWSQDLEKATQEVKNRDLDWDVSAMIFSLSNAVNRLAVAMLLQEQGR